MKAYAQGICATLVLAASATALAAAPTVPTPDRLPDNTWMLINWHGVENANQVRNTNPVLKLWHDPQFAAAREQIVSRIAEPLGKENPGPAARGQIDDALSILENPVVLGFAGDPFAGGPDTVHLFAVINKKGKEAQWARLQAGKKPGANVRVSRYSFRGTQVEKTVRTTVPAPVAGADPAAPPPQPKISTSFAATVGEYELYATGQPEIESLIARLKGNERGEASLMTDPAWQRAQRFRADGAMIEAFMKIPDLTKLPIPPARQLDMAAVIRELHVERVQGLWLSAGMGRDRMLVRAALLGDMTPGSILDIIGGNVAQFQTLAAAPVTETFSALRLDLPALHATLLRALKAGLPPDQGAAAGMMIDSMVMAQTGMLTTRLIGLFTGEIGMVSNGSEIPGANALPAATLVPLTDGEQLLATLRKVAGPLFANEEKVQGATVIRVGSGGAGAAGKGPRPFFIAVSPKMLVVSPDRAELEGVLARSAGGAAAATSLLADATFQSARKNLPAELNGLSYTDFSRMRWETHLEGLRQKLAKQKQDLLERADGVEKGSENNPPDPAQAARLRSQAENFGSISQLLSEALPLAKKHLKLSIGGSWKADDGVFFDSYVN